MILSRSMAAKNLEYNTKVRLSLLLRVSTGARALSPPLSHLCCVREADLSIM